MYGRSHNLSYMFYWCVKAIDNVFILKVMVIKSLRLLKKIGFIPHLIIISVRSHHQLFELLKYSINVEYNIKLYIILIPSNMIFSFKFFSTKRNVYTFDGMKSIAAIFSDNLTSAGVDSKVFEIVLEISFR